MKIKIDKIRMIVKDIINNYQLYFETNNNKLYIKENENSDFLQIEEKKQNIIKIKLINYYKNFLNKIDENEKRILFLLIKEKNNIRNNIYKIF
jgi:hypothetical protein